MCNGGRLVMICIFVIVVLNYIWWYVFLELGYQKLFKKKTNWNVASLGEEEGHETIQKKNN